MVRKYFRYGWWFVALAALLLTVMALAGCGPSAEPTAGVPAATAEPPANEASQDALDSADAEPKGDIAAKFELPSGTGETVSLASFAGDKNVVLVFYRGFW